MLRYEDTDKLEEQLNSLKQIRKDNKVSDINQFENKDSPLVIQLQKISETLKGCQKSNTLNEIEFKKVLSSKCSPQDQKLFSEKGEKSVINITGGTYSGCHISTGDNTGACDSNKLSDENKRLMDQKESDISEIKKLKAKLIKLEGINKDFNNDVAKLSEQIKDLNTNYDSLEIEKERLEKENANLKKGIIDIQNELEQEQQLHKLAIERFTDKIQTLKTLAESQRNPTVIGDHPQAVDSIHLSEENKRLMDLTESYILEIENLKAELIKLEGIIKEFNNDVAKLSEQIIENNTKYDSLEIEMEKLEKENENLKKDIKDKQNELELEQQSHNPAI